MLDRFQARYRGKRYSLRLPGLPGPRRTRRRSSACSSREEIGVELTEGFMMDPEASVSALVFHHPEARYFAAGAAEAVESPPA